MWKHYYKLDGLGNPCQAQMSYEPLINEDRTIFCMNFDTTNLYQDYVNKLGFVPEIAHEFFEREVEYLTRFQSYSWTPELLEIDHINKKVFFKWYDNTCNDIINTGQELPADWKKQISTIIHDQLSNGVYKITQYPHCFYVDNNLMIRTFDFHACFDFDNCVIPYSKIHGIIHKDSISRVEEAMDTDMVDMSVMFRKGMSTHIIWPENFLSTL